MNKADHAEQGKRLYREMTVTHVREQKDADCVEVVFLESARFYKLFKKNPAYDDALRLLLAAQAKGPVLRVGTASLDSDVIEEVQDIHA